MIIWNDVEETAEQKAAINDYADKVSRGLLDFLQTVQPDVAIPLHITVQVETNILSQLAASSIVQIADTFMVEEDKYIFDMKKDFENSIATLVMQALKEKEVVSN